MSVSCNGRIAKVEEGSPAASAGIRAGDELISINSAPVRDILEYNYLAAEDDLEIRVRRGGVEHVFSVECDDSGLGIEFHEELFDGLRTCHNNCVFCFVQQMPKGMRGSLNIRDDDYRLSFAHGNYITLTNVSDDDLDRICSQRMSPIYVSVHTTDPALRTAMLRSKNAHRVMEQLKRLAESRITMHTQIVLCPGFNDGEHLDRTVHDLASMHPRVASIAIVPVGLTRYREGLTPLVRPDAELAREVIESVGRWQRDFKRRFGTRLVFASDEFYLLAEKPFPSGAAYEGYPQLEDGIGVSRLFLDDLRRAARRLERRIVRPGKYTLVTGTLAAPLVQQLADLLNTQPGVQASVLGVENKFLGETVTVCGLLTGQDVASALQHLTPDETALIPDIMLNDDRFLDDITISQLKEMVRCEIIAVPAAPSGVVEALSEPAKSPRRAVSCAACAGTLSRESKLA